MIAHTNNFFVIAAIGAFTPGYVMIITKKLLPSLSQISDDQLDELNWLIEIIKKINDIQRNTSYSEFQIKHSGEDNVTKFLHALLKKYDKITTSSFKISSTSC